MAGQVPSSGAPLSDADMSLLEATIVADEEQCTQALKDGANPNVTNRNGMSPLIILAGGPGRSGSALMQMLLEAGASVNLRDRQGWSPLLYTASSGQMQLLELLLKHG